MIYLCQADPAEDLVVPNLALLRLAAYYRARGETVRLLRDPGDYVPLLDPRPTRVLGSAIFTTSAPRMIEFERLLGPVTWGGTGVRLDSNLREIDAAHDWDAAAPDYADVPACTCSVGFLTRGCVMRCPFCVVPRKEGRPSIVSAVTRIWRGEPWPRHLELLDNDAFSKALRSFWRDAVRELNDGKFRVCFSQGINLRLIDDEAAALVASLKYTDHSFSLKSRRLYTAWDNLGDQRVFERGVARLDRAGIPPGRLIVYMLIGFDPQETWEAIFYRYTSIRALGADVYPMPYERWRRPDLAHFQRWVLGRAHKVCAFPEYEPLPDALRATVTAAWDRAKSGWTPPRRLEVQHA